MPQLAVLTLVLALFCGVSVEAQGLGIVLDGARNQCRPSWDFAAGSVQAHFSAGRLSGTASQPPRFEVDQSCGDSALFITFSSFVKNVKLRVAAGTFPANVWEGVLSTLAVTASSSPYRDRRPLCFSGARETAECWST